MSSSCWAQANIALTQLYLYRFLSMRTTCPSKDGQSLLHEDCGNKTRTVPATDRFIILCNVIFLRYSISRYITLYHRFQSYHIYYITSTPVSLPKIADWGLQMNDKTQLYELCALNYIKVCNCHPIPSESLCH
jgi:hypothetical protein